MGSDANDRIAVHAKAFSVLGRMVHYVLEEERMIPCKSQKLCAKEAPEATG